MNSVLMKALMPFIVALFWMLSLFVFLRGHNNPGGGFIGALCFGLGLLAFSFSVEQPSEIFKKAVPIARITILIGLFSFILSMIMPLFIEKEIFEALWSQIKIPLAGKLSSVLLFDFGVYLIVSSSIVFIFKQIFSGVTHD